MDKKESDEYLKLLKKINKKEDFEIKDWSQESSIIVGTVYYTI